MNKTIYLIGLMCLTISSAAQKQFRALLFTKTNGWHHESIHEGVDAIRKMADRHWFDVEWHEDPARFNDNNLAKFDVIIFLNTTGDILNNDQQAAMEKFIKAYIQSFNARQIKNELTIK